MQTLTAIPGIYGTPVTGSAVNVTSTGQLVLSEMQEQQQINATQAAEIRDLKRTMLDLQSGLLKLPAKDAQADQR